MAFRFWRRVRIAKGVTLNFSKGGVSASFGPRGAKYTVGRRGQRATVGLPGTGLFYTTHSSSSSRSAKKTVSTRNSASGQTPAPSCHLVSDRLTPGFFKRLMIPKDELQFIEGLKEFTAGHHRKASSLLKECLQIPDAAYVCGFLALNDKDLELAERAFKAALAQHGELGRRMAKYGLELSLGLNITDEIAAQLSCDRRGVLLGLVEVWQNQERFQEAADALLELRTLLPSDVVIKLSLAELLLTTDPKNKEHAEYVVKMTARLDNECDVHAALLLYKARALRVLGMYTAARDTLTAGLRRKKDRPEELLKALTYERALVYEDLGQKARARGEFESLYAEDPGYEDVAKKVGMK